MQGGEAGSLDGALIVMQMFTEGFVAVQFIVGHRQIGVTHPDIGAFHPACALIIAGPLGQIDGGYFRRADREALRFRDRKDSADRWFHLIALLRHLLLQVLEVVDAHHLEPLLLIQAEQQHPAAVLVGKAGQGVIQTFWAALMGFFHFERLAFRLLTHRCIHKFQKFFGKHLQNLPSCFLL